VSPSAGSRSIARPATPAREHGLSRAVKLAVATIGLVSTVVGLVFVVWDHVRQPPTPTRLAQLSDLELEPSMTFRQYLARIDQPIADYTPAKLARRGAFVDFHVEAVGYKGEPLVLKWELWRAGGDQVDESRARELTPVVDDDNGRQQFWVPLPRSPGSFIVLVELLEQQQYSPLQLDKLRTVPFRGAG
jgi:hypothetical protein